MVALAVCNAALSTEMWDSSVIMEGHLRAMLDPLQQVVTDGVY
jgi:hypothetical protein